MFRKSSQRLMELLSLGLKSISRPGSSFRACVNSFINWSGRSSTNILEQRFVTRQAKERGISVSTLLEQEVNNTVQPVSEEEIRNMYEKNKERIGVEFDKVHDQIRDYLREQKIAERKNEYFKTLRAKANVTTYLKPPPVQRADVSVNGAPVRGSEKAKVTIVKFEDFQCPFCKTAQPTFKDLLKKYDGKVRVVHKDLPLEAIHPLGASSGGGGAVRWGAG